ncbi:MAG: hypothetical protein KJ018_13210 [Burkholderiales bacterium]|nr:hypothetical protein [Burkholderiales bacterium]
MTGSACLAPHEAEAVVQEAIERFGLGALPRLTVTATADGAWTVRWDHMERRVEPMAMEAWVAWLERNVGSLDAGDLETTES